jgi:aminoglycoside phosphotransferase family enzyme
VIIDCLEFNRNFRILDAASELSFLALECERLGAPRIGRLIFETYSEKTGDSRPAIYCCFTKVSMPAFVRRSPYGI